MSWKCGNRYDGPLLVLKEERKRELAGLQTAPGMEIAGQAAVPASPPGPSHDQHHQRDMAIPADPAADFVLVQSHILRRFEVFFNMPAGADGRNHLGQGGALWPKDEVVGLLERIAEAPTNEQPVPSIFFPAM